MLSPLSRKAFLGLVVSLFLASLAFGLFTPNAYSDKEKANQYFRQGIELYHNYKYQASVDFFLKSLSANPKHHQARKMLGQAYYFSGDINNAVQEWSSIFRYGGKDASLKLHIQNLSILDKVDEKAEWDRRFSFFKEINSQTGFRYRFPSFITVLPNQNRLILAKDGLDNGVLLEMSPDGEFLDNMRRISGKLEFPMAAVLNNEEIWVVDYGSDTIHRLKWSRVTKRFPLIFSSKALGSTGSGKMQFRGPTGICHQKGFYFVVDNGNHRVQKITEDGNFNLMFRETRENHYLEKPFGIACHKNGKIYVSEVERGRIAVFDEYGNFEKHLGESFLKKPRHVQLSHEQTHLVIADEYEGVLILDLEKNHFKKIKEYTKGEQESDSLVKPYSAMLDRNQNLLVADHASHSVLHFLPESHLTKNIELWIERIDNKQFPTVALWVSVKSSSDKYITGLRESNFRITENEAPIRSLRTDHTRQFRHQMSVSILISRSSKMKPYYPDSSLWALEFVVNDLREKDQVKLVSYDQKYRDETPWTNSRLRLRQGVRVSQPSQPAAANIENSMSAVGKALYYSASELLPKRGKKALIWLTEGELGDDEFGFIGFQRISHYLRLNHIRLYIISFENPEVTDVKNKKEILKELAENTGGKYYHAYSSELQGMLPVIRNQEEGNLVVYYNSEASKSWKDQYMDIRMSVHFQGRIGAETSGYFIP